MGGQHHALATLTPIKRPCTQCTGGLVGLRAGLDWCGKSRPYGIQSLHHTARSESLYRLYCPDPQFRVYFFQFYVSFLLILFRSQFYSILCVCVCVCVYIYMYSIFVSCARFLSHKPKSSFSDYENSILHRINEICTY